MECGSGDREHEESIASAAAGGAGTIIRGGVARGAPSMQDSSLEGLPDFFRQRVEERRDRWQDAKLEDLLGGMSRMEFMLRFTQPAAIRGASSCASGPTSGVGLVAGVET